MASAKLLLVDDDEALRHVLAAVLVEHGYDVTTAGSVPKALKLITVENYDVLLSNLHMPGKGDGLTVVSAMRHANPKAVTNLLGAFPEMYTAGSCHSAAGRSDSGKVDKNFCPDRSDRAKARKWTSSLSRDRERAYDSRILDREHNRRVVRACQEGQNADGCFYESRAACRSYSQTSDRPGASSALFQLCRQ
jgi:CheY-like chemotaxis protein